MLKVKTEMLELHYTFKNKTKSNKIYTKHIDIDKRQTLIII